MPRRPLGSPNRYGARRPVCSEVLVISRHKRPGYQYACPRALLGEHRTWDWSERDAARLVAGERTEWHERREP